MSEPLRFSRVKGTFAVYRLPADAAVPALSVQGQFFSVTHTAEELSIVCLRENVPAGLPVSIPWACLKLHGPFPFELTGVLASILNPLAEAGIGIFAVSTFDTDYILVKEEAAEAAIAAITAAGHQFVP